MVTDLRSDPENPRSNRWERSIARVAYFLAAPAAMFFGLKLMLDNLGAGGEIRMAFVEGVLWAFVGLHFVFHGVRIPRS
jgi:hypothetical protein